jgi:decaprenylphospho-beta-D-ribofuranose 2-oxidase
MVSWIDPFSKGAKEGRGLFHSARYVHEPDRAPLSLRTEEQDLPDTLLGMFPKATMWRTMQNFNTRAGMKFINSLKHKHAAEREHGRIRHQPIVAFQFLLDYVPNWELAYGPRGMRQMQIFVPKASAFDVFREVLRIQQEHKMEAFLVVMKQHKKDLYWLTHSVDGFSLAMDFKIPPANERRRFEAMMQRLIDLTLSVQGRFYFAKDDLLSKEQARSFLGSSELNKFRSLRSELDPQQLITNNLAERIGLTSCMDIEIG